jgi:hypothetical protein
MDSEQAGGKGRREARGKTTLHLQTQTWATPRADSKEGSRTDAGNPAKDGKILTQQARNWPTPNTPSGGGRTTNVGGYTEDGRKIQKELEATAIQWQTPNSQNFTSRKQVGDTERQPLLEQQASQWPTPQARDEKIGESLQDPGNSRPLNEAVLKFLHPVPVIWPNGEKLSTTRRILRPRLNPAFVCWLMGWPMWWTRPEPISFAAQEMVLWRSKARWHLWNFFAAR